MDMAKAGLGVEVHTRPRGAHDWRETPASEILDARTLKAAAQVCLGSSAQLPHMLPLPVIWQSFGCSIVSPLLYLLLRHRSCVYSIIWPCYLLEAALARVF